MNSHNTAITPEEQAAWHAGLDEGRVQGRAAMQFDEEWGEEQAQIEATAAALQRICNKEDRSIYQVCAFLLAGALHKLGAAQAEFTFENFEVDGEPAGDWRVTVERVEKTPDDAGADAPQVN